MNFVFFFGFSETFVIYYHKVIVAHSLVQRAFVLCRLKKKTDEKTNVTARDEGEESSYIASDFENPMPEDTIPEVKRSMPYGYFPYQLLIWTMRSIFETNACLFTILNSGT